MNCPLEVDRMLAYLVGELTDEQADTLEEHLFSCDRCGPRFESLATMRDAVVEAIRGAEVAGNVDASFVHRAEGEGLRLCEYRITEGGKVFCKAGAEDFVVVRLAADFDDVEGLRLEGKFEDLERHESRSLPTRDVVVDRGLGEVLLVFPGDIVRTYPRSQWTLRLQGSRSGNDTEIGPFVMDHTP